MSTENYQRYVFFERLMMQCFASNITNVIYLPDAAYPSAAAEITTKGKIIPK